MADFLTKSTAEEIDLDRAASAFPDISLDGSSDIPLPSVPSKASGAFSWDDFSAAPAQPDVKVTGGDEIATFQDQFPELEVPSSQAFTAPAPPTAPAVTYAPRPQPSAYTPILTAPIPTTEEDEPQVIKDWREKQAEEIRARDETSKAKRQEIITKAERAIDAFYEDYSAKRTKVISENKEQEIVYLNELTLSLSAGTTWSRICDLIELQNSQSKTLARTGPSTSDLSRFKEVLLKLRRDGESAPGAAGY